MRTLLFLASALLLAACSTSCDTATRRAVPTPGATSASGRASAAPGRTSASPVRSAGVHTVTFTVGGTVRRSSVTYTTESGQQRRSVVSPPWSRTFTVNEGATFDVSAHSDGNGTLSCTLKVDGELLKSAMSSGDSMTVDCGDTLGF